jgi:hypothetical protein
MSKINAHGLFANVKKLMRNINSFIFHPTTDMELIIVSNNCDISTQLYHFYYQNYKNIRLLELGSVKNEAQAYIEAINYAQSTNIMHLNPDFMLTPIDLSDIMETVQRWHFIKFNTIYISFDPETDEVEDNNLLNIQNILFKKSKNNFNNFDSITYTKEIGNKYWKEVETKKEFFDTITNDFSGTYFKGVHSYVF